MRVVFSLFLSKIFSRSSAVYERVFCIVVLIANKLKFYVPRPPILKRDATSLKPIWECSRLHHMPSDLPRMAKHPATQFRQPSKVPKLKSGLMPITCLE